jgi:hypothetical protein
MTEYYNVLTSYGNYAFKIGTLFFVVLIIWTFIMLIVLSIVDEGKYLKYFKFTFFVYPIFILIPCYLYIDGKKNWERIFNNKEYEIVEGYVENFIPEKGWGDKRDESFSINGKYFSYSRFYFTGYYNNSNSIIKEGLYLKIYHRGNGIISIWINE